MSNGNKHRLKLMNVGAAMKPCDFESMSTDKLWTLHEKMTATLARKLAAEKTRLEKRLRQLKQGSNANGRIVGHARRPYPQVFPKYKNPEQPSETWAGRGKQPRWLSAQLRSGKNSMISEFICRTTLVGAHTKLNCKRKDRPKAVS
jgi:DNA-binding protein H-NS